LCDGNNVFSFVGFTEGLHVGSDVEEVGCVDGNVLGKCEFKDGRLVILSEGLCEGRDVRDFCGVRDGMECGLNEGKVVGTFVEKSTGRFEGFDVGSVEG
jgi:hypothetical protein